jgi:hypothetical protein
MTLGSLRSDSSCYLFGWTGSSTLIRRDSVTVFGPQNCNPNSPQVFCSSFMTPNHFSCDAQLGSPLVCGDLRRIAGFVISDGSCSVDGTRNMLSYHSVGQFDSWIREVTGSDSQPTQPTTPRVTPTPSPTTTTTTDGAETTRKCSILLILSVLIVSFIK